MAKHDIVHQTSYSYTSQHQGVAEKNINRHLIEVVRSVMFHANVPKQFWNDVMLSVCYLINKIHTKILNELSLLKY